MRRLTILPLLLLASSTALAAAVEVDSVQGLWNLGQRDSALALSSAQVQLARESGDSVRLAGMLQLEGKFLSVFGGNREGEVRLREAVALAEALPDSALLVESLRWLGLSVSSQGRGDESALISDRVLELALILGDKRQEGWARVGRAYRAWRRGDAEEAAQGYREAAACFPGTGDTEGELWARNGLAMVQTNRGEYEEALAVYRANLALARAAKLAKTEAIALNNLGTLEYSLGRPDQALLHFEEAVAFNEAQGYRREMVLPLLNTAICLNDLGRTDQAKANLERARALCREQGYADLEPKALIKLAETLNIEGSHNAAVEQLHEALAMKPALMLADEVNARISLAGTYEKLERDTEAQRELERAAALLAGSTMNWQQLRVEGRRAQMEAKLGNHREAVDRLLRLAEQAGEQGVLEFRFTALADAARSLEALARPDSARLLYDEAARAWEGERRLLLDPEWRERRGSTGRRIFTDLAALLLARGEVEASFDRLQSYKARTLMERMFGPGDRYARRLAETGAGAPSLADLRRNVLAEDEVFVDFYLGPSRSLVFAATLDTLRVRELPTGDDLEPRLRAYFELLASPSAAEPAAIAAAGGHLATELFGERLELLGSSSRVTVSPDGALNLLPFAELPGCRERLWSRAPSANILLHQHREARSSAPAGRLLALVSGRGEAGADLAGARAEVALLASRYRGVETRALDADTSALASADLVGRDILHIAAHARNFDQSPWQSAIRFRPGDESGELRAAEIAGWKLDASLAVLSSCSSAGGGILSGEGVQGLASAFISAGVPAVLATLWAVDDAATARLVREFYSGLAGGESAAAALALAQADLRSRDETAHPYYWAGFVLIGDGHLRARLEPRPSLALPAVLLLGGLAFLLFFVILRKR